jgi:hypothetical protein
MGGTFIANTKPAVATHRTTALNVANLPDTLATIGVMCAAVPECGDVGPNNCQGPGTSSSSRMQALVGSREWITTVACICADGTAIPPVLIFASKNSTLQSTWVNDIKATKHSAHIGSSSTGWSNDEMGLDWLKNVFNRYTKEKARGSWRILILDGHGSHLIAACIEYCFEIKILLIIYPPHATHTLQPLDVVMFWSLPFNYKEILSTQVQDSQGLLLVKKMDFSLIFWTAWTNLSTKDYILQAFESTGVWLMDLEPVLKKFHPPTTKDQEDLEFERLKKVSS